MFNGLQLSIQHSCALSDETTGMLEVVLVGAE
jgi:hypothetical protein